MSVYNVIISGCITVRLDELEGLAGLSAGVFMGPSVCIYGTLTFVFMGSSVYIYGTFPFIFMGPFCLYLWDLSVYIYGTFLFIFMGPFRLY